MRIDSAARITSLRVQTKCEGLGLVLGPLELAVMHAIWESDRPNITNKEVLLELARAGQLLALPTVASTMRRLADKGYLIEAKEERNFVYVPTMTEDELETFVVEHILARLREFWPDLMGVDSGEVLFNDY